MNTHRSPLHLIFASTLLFAWLILTITVTTAQENSAALGSYHASTGIFTSASGNYRATFESEPSSKVVNLDASLAKKFSDFAFSSITKTSLSLTDGHVGVDFLTSAKLGDLDLKEQKQFIAEFYNALIEGEDKIKGLSAKTLTIPGISTGVEIHVAVEKNDGFELRMRLLISNETLYFVAVVGKSEFVESATADTFFTSFQMLNGPEDDVQTKLVSATIPTADARDRFTTIEDGFSILLPGKPTKEQVNLAENSSAPTVQTQYSVSTTEGTYMVSLQAVAQIIIDRSDLQEVAFKAARDSLVTAFKGTVLSERNVLIDNQVIGREIRISMPESQGEFRAQFFVTNGRFYQIIALGAGEFATSSEAEEVFKSFRLLNREQLAGMKQSPETNGSLDKKCR